MVTSNGGFSITQIAVVSVAVTVGLGVLAAFWSLSDPRTEIKLIRDTYLSIREHEEFKNRVGVELQALHNEDSGFLSRTEFDRWVRERDKLIDGMRDDIRELKATRPTTGELQATTKAIESRLDQVEEQKR